MAISLFLSRGQLSNVRVNQLISELEEPEKVYVRVPGESRSGICPFCAQFVFMQHDGSGSEVPLPVIGTHDNCVCQDIFVPVFQLNTKASLQETFNVPPSRFSIRKAKAGKVERFEWLKQQSRATQRRILGVTRVGMLQQEKISIEKLYNKKTKQPKPVKRG